MFSLATREDGNYSDAGLMDFWVWMFVVSSTFASYVGKVSVRVDLQRIGFAIPGFIGPVCAVTIAFIFDTISYGKGYSNTNLKILTKRPEVTLGKCLY